MCAELLAEAQTKVQASARPIATWWWCRASPGLKPDIYISLDPIWLSVSQPPKSGPESSGGDAFVPPDGMLTAWPRAAS